jgi:hypothetical protein
MEKNGILPPLASPKIETLCMSIIELNYLSNMMVVGKMTINTVAEIKV